MFMHSIHCYRRTHTIPIVFVTLFILIVFIYNSYLAYCSSSTVVAVDFAAVVVAGYEFDAVALFERVMGVITILLLVAYAVQLPLECMPSLELASSALTWPTFFD